VAYLLSIESKVANTAVLKPFRNCRACVTTVVNAFRIWCLALRLNGIARVDKQAKRISSHEKPAT
jgi:hypothetical protein